MTMRITTRKTMELVRRAVCQVMDRWSLQGFCFQHYLEMFVENLAIL